MKSIDEATVKKLLESACKARENAYAPYSGFLVGAALLARDGRVFLGCNVENASFGATNCAERTAVYSAVAAGCRDFEAIAIVAGDKTVYPCGICRQVLAEFSPDITVICGKNDACDTLHCDTFHYEKFQLSELLPHGFNL